MSQDVRQWLAEIKLLQQRLAEAKQERDEALASAANWRGLYETEAKQRRAETAQSQQTIAQLEEQITALKGIPAHLLSSAAPTDQAAIAQEINQLEGESTLKEHVIATLMERDRLPLLKTRSPTCREHQCDRHQNKRDRSPCYKPKSDRSSQKSDRTPLLQMRSPTCRKHQCDRHQNKRDRSHTMNQNTIAHHKKKRSPSITTDAIANM